MRILDLDNDKSIKNAIIYLKINEAKELLDSINEIVKENDLNNHVHIGDIDFSHEITLTLYDEQKLDMLDERSRKIIIQDI
ncbi:MAG: hypothetical protein PHD15_05705 [Clostridia bacterium]|nr:hypothetical protein [Clostridia bacterium]MDD4387227.1 hypothetical protein [Clostridia bacterium]